MRTPILAAILSTVPLCAQHDYLVLSAVAAEDAFDAAAKVLAAAHHAEIVRFDPADLEPLRAVLTAAQPRNVAIVMRPEQLEFDVARRFLQLATEIDDDPFVDFAFGYITGANGQAATELATRGAARRPAAIARGIATVAGGADRSLATAHPHALRSTRLDALQLQCAGEQAFPTTGRDLAFLHAHLPKLAGREIVMFVGHGMPREVVGGPTFAELAGIDLGGAVVLNVACYTGVTGRWYDDDDQRRVVRARELPLAESFCLALLRRGVVGYTAYLCPRPAGPELDNDLAALIADGESLGNARRRDYDKTVLGFLGFGEPRLQLARVTDCASFAPNRDAVRDLMLEGATGGVLFGDPACVPFVARADDAPVAIECAAGAEAITIDARVAANALYLHCNDPTARWGEGMAMKVLARIPLGSSLVTDVLVDQLRLGTKALPTRVLWAIEEDHGERFLQVKFNFPRPERFSPASLRLTARALTTTDATLAKNHGGEVRRRPTASRDVRAREVQPFMLELAAAREVSPEVLQAALDASALLLEGGDVATNAVETLVAHGSEGFRAVIVLLEAGHTHHRTWQLLRATWRPGDERHLLALASGPDLPNYAMWSVLEGLGVADTPEVRTYLRDRFAREEDAGLFMATAKGLAHLGERATIEPLTIRILEQRNAWQGVEPHLIAALGAFGGREAIAALERIVQHDGRARETALATLRKLDPAAAARLEPGGSRR